MKFKISIILLLTTFAGKAQNNFILAGQHSPADYYHNFIPDTMAISTYSIGYYPLDINNDGVMDFKFELVAPGTGLGSNYYACAINGLNNNAIAFGYSDSCLDVNNIYVSKKEMVYAFNYNDTIDNNKVWSSSLFLSHTEWITWQYSCASYKYNYKSYIGVRVLVDSIYKYGWIKIDSMTFDPHILGLATLTMGQYACENNVAGINSLSDINNSIIVYPNPANSIIHVDLNRQAAIQNLPFQVTDLLGNVIKQEKFRAKRSTIDISDFKNGIYLMRITAGEETLTKKIVVAR